MTQTVSTLTPMTSEQARDLADAALAVARRFHAGATMWAVAPKWGPHAHHIAVEFVHPVIVGKRALPAVALVDSDPVAQTRVAARPGDIIVLVAEANDVVAQQIARRAPAWGALVVWIGNGPRPAVGAADHVLWVDDSDPMVAMTGQFVLRYHLLWELTHVCFEHPGLMRAEEPECTDEVCVTCSDEGRLGEVVQAPTEAHEPALVRTADGEEDVDVTVVAPVVAGDLILVHAGAALTRLSQEALS